MLSALEKVAVGISAFCAIATLVPYVLLGTPSTVPTVLLPEVKPVSVPALKGTTSAGELAPPPKVLTQSNKEVFDALATQNPRVRRVALKRQTYDVPPALLDALSVPANWTKQLKTARSQVLKANGRPSRLKVDKISSDSYLRKFGFKDGDIIELIDGNVTEFSEDSSSALYGIFNDKLDKLEDGEPISITVSRGGSLVHLEFKLP